MRVEYNHKRKLPRTATTLAAARRSFDFSFPSKLEVPLTGPQVASADAQGRRRQTHAIGDTLLRAEGSV